MDRFLIIYADFEGIRHGFRTHVRREFPGADVMVGLGPVSGLSQRAAQLYEMEGAFAISTPSGLSGTLATLYRTALQKFPDLQIVRLDADQLDLRALRDLLQPLADGFDAVAIDEIPSDPTEEQKKHEVDVRSLVRKAFHGKIVFGSRHSSQAWNPRPAAASLDIAQRVAFGLARGFDLAMLLGVAGERVKVLSRPGVASSMNSKQINDELAELRKIVDSHSNFRT